MTCRGLAATGGVTLIQVIRQRLRDCVATCFAPREVLIRSNGRVKYLYLSTRQQLLGAALLGGAVSCVLGVVALSAIPARNAAEASQAGTDQTAPVYTGLAAEVNDYFNQLRTATSPAASASVVTDIALQIAAPDAPASNTISASGEDVARRNLRLALQKKLRSFDSDVQQIAARNQSLPEQVAALTETVQALSQSTQRLEQQNNELTAELARRDTEKTALTGQVQELTRQLAMAHSEQQAETARLADLQGKVKAADQDKSGLAQQVARTEQALSTMITQRNVLRNMQSEMSQSMSGLKERLASLQETQADFVSGLAERARSNMVEMEKTVAMTGLNVEKLLRVTDDDHSGQGGPFIPVSASVNARNVVEHKLMASVATLGGEVERWEKLRLILHSLPLTAPIDHYYISSGFGERIDPINGEAAIHEGVDMVGALRSEVLATAPGTVVMAGWQSGYGRVVEIDHGFGIHTFYAHLDSIQVTKGQTVDYRDVLGRLGTTGRTSGPHVHYEVRYDKKALDPMGFLKAGRYVFKG